LWGVFLLASLFPIASLDCHLPAFSCHPKRCDHIKVIPLVKRRIPLYYLENSWTELLSYNGLLGI
jgi:hypothetical protein